MIIIEPGPQRVNPPTLHSFTLSIRDVDIVIDPINFLGESTNRDSIYHDYSSGTTRKDAIIEVSPISYLLPVLSSSDPSLATIDQSGYISTVSAGRVQMMARIGPTIRGIEHNGRFVVTPSASVWDRYDNDTLGDEIKDQIDSLIASNNESMDLLSGDSWNPNCWASSLDWSGVAISNSTGNNRRGATLISPQHVYMATHFPVGIGATITYRTIGNEDVTRTLTARQDVGGDIMIGLLDSPVAGLKHYSVLPANWESYLSLHRQPQIICTDQQRKAILREWRDAYSNNNVIHYPVDQLSEEIVPGDSGQPTFIPVDSELILLGSHSGTHSFRNAAATITEINSAMTSLGGGYQLTIADLSAYTNYGPP